MDEARPMLVPELCVTNVDASRAFYVDLLGFDILFERQEEGFLYLAREGAELMLDAVDQGRTWRTGQMEPPFGRGINLMFWTADVDGLYRHVRDAGIPIFLELEEKWYRCGDVYNGSRQFLLQDPDGYLLRFAQDMGERDAPPSV